MSNQHFIPPPLAERLAGRALDEVERSVRLGDLEERFQYVVRELGLRRARNWYRRQVFALSVLALINSILWSGIMFKNNLIIAWRNIKKSKAYSVLNILDVAAGMAVFILIMLFVRTELSYDRYHANADNIYRILAETPGDDYQGSDVMAFTPSPMAPAMIRDFPQVQTAARIRKSSDVLISVGEKNYLEKTFHWADPQTFDIFSFPLVRGDRAAALKDPFSILVSERETRRLFGAEDPVGRTIVYHDRDKAFDFRVAGVFRDIPANSHFRMDIIAPYETQGKIGHEFILRWENPSAYTYVLLKGGTNTKALELGLPSFVEKQTKNNPRIHPGQKTRYLFQPMKRIHLYSRANFDMAQTGDIRFILLFATISVLILAIACINYTNLAAARSLKRVKEIGLRKVVGAAKGQIVRQFLGDSMMMAFLALLLAVGMVLLALPAFRSFVEREIAFNPYRDAVLTLALILLAAIVGAIAGSYPAFFVSSFRPITSLKGTGVSRFKGRGLRNTLIVFQFAASIALIICTIGVRGQLRFIRNTDMGYEREQILSLPLPRGVFMNRAAFKADLIKNPHILKAAVSDSLPNNVESSTNVRRPGTANSAFIPFYTLWVDHNYIDLFGLKIVQGRNFSTEFASDAQSAYLINESAQKALGLANPIGRDIGYGRGGKIIGVVKDFHMHSLHLPISPLLIELKPEHTCFLSVKIRAGNIPATLAFVRETWKRFAPEYPFEYTFFDEIFDKAYRTEQRLGTMYSIFAGLAIFIACLGLVGLAAFTAEQKTKEIGIRKVLGASSPGIIILLSREFMKWVVLANIIAWPVGYWAMRSWLENFAYRMTLTLPMFLGAALAAFFFAAAVIGLQTYRAASANPADSMRYE